jgi:hypothetical protein
LVALRKNIMNVAGSIGLVYRTNLIAAQSNKAKTRRKIDMGSMTVDRVIKDEDISHGRHLHGKHLARVDSIVPSASLEMVLPMVEAQAKAGNECRCLLAYQSYAVCTKLCLR